MLLFHTTVRDVLTSVLEKGLDPAYSTQGMKAVWFHDSSKAAWAAAHCTRRKACRPEDLVVLAVSVDPEGIRRHARGIYYTTSLVPPDDFLSATGYLPVEIPLPKRR